MEGRPRRPAARRLADDLFPPPRSARWARRPRPRPAGRPATAARGGGRPGRAAGTPCPTPSPRDLEVSAPSRVSKTIVVAERACVYGRLQDGCQVGAVALEAGVRLTRRARTGRRQRRHEARRRPPGQPQRRAVVDAGQDVDRVGALLDAAALATARRAGVGDDLARAAAAGARGRGHHLPDERLPDPLHLAGAPHSRQAIGWVPSAAPVASQASHATAVLTVTGCCEPKTASSNSRSTTCSRSSPRGGPAGPAGGHRRGWSRRTPRTRRRCRRRSRTDRRRWCCPRPRRAVGVVALALLGVGQHLVGARDLLEPRLDLGIAVPRVGVELAGEAAVGALDLFLGGVPGDAEQLVVVGRQGWLALGQAVGETMPTTGNRGQRLGVVHTGGTQHADRSSSLALDLVGRHDQGALGEGRHAGLGPDGDVQATIDDVPNERHDDILLLEDAQDPRGPSRSRRTPGPCGLRRPRRPARDHRPVGGRGRRVPARPASPRGTSPVAGTDGRTSRALPARWAVMCMLAVATRSSPTPEGKSMVLLDRSVAQHGDEDGRRGAEPDELHRPDGGLDRPRAPRPRW